MQQQQPQQQQPQQLQPQQVQPQGMPLAQMGQLPGQKATLPPVPGLGIIIISFTLI